MSTIAQNGHPASQPAAELERSLSEFLAPVTRLLPEARLRAVVKELVHGVHAVLRLKGVKALLNLVMEAILSVI